MSAADPAGRRPAGSAAGAYSAGRGTAREPGHGGESGGGRSMREPHDPGRPARGAEPRGDRRGVSPVPPAVVAAAAARVCPGFSAGAVMRVTRKSVLMTGSVGRNPVVVKYLTDDSPAWTQRLRHEISAYRTFTRQRPPVRVPRLFGADPERRVLVLEHVPGRPAAVERHPGSALARADVRSVLHAFGALNAWKPPSGSFQAAFDYLPRVQRYHALGLLTDRDATDLAQLIRGLARAPLQLCHGDAMFSNILLTSHGPALVDWEFVGYHLPGYDLAVLWSLLARDPLTRRHIGQVAQQGGSFARDAFLVNLMLVLVREIRIHDQAAAGEEDRRLLRRLHDDSTTVRRAVRAAVGTH
ncbi:aminoglycoside phosphotransferase family protein [Uniformispora flossi]|uniref:aminoglycoside phosphotransferase family protein n=1 Tax=Uniformispora flossi TaxID=3390723 RepID=UPI003C2CAF17